MEAAHGNSVFKVEKEYFGTRPKEITTNIAKDMVKIRPKGILTPAKEKVRDNPEGAGLIQRMRETLLKNNQEVLRAALQNLTGSQVVSLYTDLSVEHTEKFLILAIDEDLEPRVRKRAVHTG